MWKWLRNCRKIILSEKVRTIVANFCEKGYWFWNQGWWITECDFYWIPIFCIKYILVRVNCSRFCRTYIIHIYIQYKQSSYSTLNLIEPNVRNIMIFNSKSFHWVHNCTSSYGLQLFEGKRPGQTPTVTWLSVSVLVDHVPSLPCKCILHVLKFCELAWVYVWYCITA